MAVGLVYLMLVRMLVGQFSVEPWGVGLDKGDKVLCQKVNNILAEALHDGTWTKIFDATLGSSGIHIPQPTPPTPTAPERAVGLLAWRLTALLRCDRLLRVRSDVFANGVMGHGMVLQARWAAGGQVSGFRRAGREEQRSDCGTAAERPPQCPYVAAQSAVKAMYGLG